MSYGLAIWLALWLALSSGLAAVLHCSHFPRAYRIAPSLFVGSVAMALADKGLMVFGLALTQEQAPLKGYLLPMVILWGSATVLTLVLADRRDCQRDEHECGLVQ